MWRSTSSAGLPWLASLLAPLLAAAGGESTGESDPAPVLLPPSLDVVFGGSVNRDPAREGYWNGERADAYAPAGVSGDHLHSAGNWMLSLRYTSVNKDGNMNGRSSITTQDVFDQGYSTSPTGMTVSTLALSLMYAPSSRLTLVATLPYLSKSMDHLQNPALTPGGEFTTEAQGVGDLRLTTLYGILDKPHHRAHFNLGLGFPTGSVSESDDTPTKSGARLPYPMQLGSGSFELVPAATYTGQSSELSWGSQLSYTVRLNQNSEDYTVGNQLDITAWGAKRWMDGFSSSLRVSWSEWDDVEGRDPLLPTLPGPPGFPIPTADPNLQAGQRLDLGLGLNILATGGALKGNWLGIEFLFPLHQDLDGPQLETDWTLIAGWQLSF